MPTSLGSAVLTLQVRTAPLLAGLKQSTKRVQNFVGSVTKLSRNLESFGQRTGLVGVALGSMFIPAIRQGSRFEKQMSAVKAVLGDLRDESDLNVRSFAELAQKAKDLGAKTTFTASQAAEGMQFLALAGFNTTQVLAATESTLRLAEAGMLKLSRAAEITANNVNAFHLAAESAGRVADVLAAAAANSDTTIDGLGESFKFAAPVAAALGQSIEDTAVALGVLANQGIKNTISGTALAQVLAKLAKEQDKANEMLQKYGSSFAKVNPEIVSIIEIVKEFQRVNVSTGDIMRLFEQRAGRAFLAMKKAGAAAFDDLVDKINNSFGEALEQALIKIENFSGAVRILTSVFESVNIEFFESFKDEITSVVRGLSTFLRVTREWISNNKQLTKVLAIVTASLSGLLLVVAGLSIVGASLLVVFAHIGALVIMFFALKAVLWVLGLTILPVLGAVLLAVGSILLKTAVVVATVGAAFLFFEELVRHSWSEVKKAALALYKGVIKPVFEGMVFVLHGVWKAFDLVFNKFMLPLFKTAITAFARLADAIPIHLWKSFGILIAVLTTMVLLPFTTALLAIVTAFTLISGALVIAHDLFVGLIYMVTLGRVRLDSVSESLERQAKAASEATRALYEYHKNLKEFFDTIKEGNNDFRKLVDLMIKGSDLTSLEIEVQLKLRLEQGKKSAYREFLHSARQSLQEAADRAADAGVVLDEAPVMGVEWGTQDFNQLDEQGRILMAAQARLHVEKQHLEIQKKIIEASQGGTEIEKRNLTVRAASVKEAQIHLDKLVEANRKGLVLSRERLEADMLTNAQVVKNQKAQEDADSAREKALKRLVTLEDKLAGRNLSEIDSEIKKISDLQQEYTNLAEIRMHALQTEIAGIGLANKKAAGEAQDLNEEIQNLIKEEKRLFTAIETGEAKENLTKDEIADLEELGIQYDKIKKERISASNRLRGDPDGKGKRSGGMPAEATQRVEDEKKAQDKLDAIQADDVRQFEAFEKEKAGAIQRHHAESVNLIEDKEQAQLESDNRLVEAAKISGDKIIRQAKKFIKDRDDLTQDEKDKVLDLAQKEAAREIKAARDNLKGQAKDRTKYLRAQEIEDLKSKNKLVQAAQLAGQQLIEDEREKFDDLKLVGDERAKAEVLLQQKVSKLIKDAREDQEKESEQAKKLKTVSDKVLENLIKRVRTLRDFVLLHGTLLRLRAIEEQFEVRMQKRRERRARDEAAKAIRLTNLRISLEKKLSEAAPGSLEGKGLFSKLQKVDINEAAAYKTADMAAGEAGFGSLLQPEAAQGLDPALIANMETVRTLFINMIGEISDISDAILMEMHEAPLRWVDALVASLQEALQILRDFVAAGMPADFNVPRAPAAPGGEPNDVPPAIAGRQGGDSRQFIFNINNNTDRDELMAAIGEVIGVSVES